MPSRRDSILGTVLTTIVVTSILVGGGTYLWQGLNTDETVNAAVAEVRLKMQGQIDELTAQLDKVRREESTDDPEEPEGPKPPLNIAGVSFTSCNTPGAFASLPWYAALTERLKKKSVAIESLTALCYSPNANLAVMLAPATTCGSGFAAFRYQTVTDELDKAMNDFKQESCPVTPTTFGKRDGAIIHLEESGPSDACTARMNYDYNFSDNTVTLLKACKKCPGDEVEACKGY